MSAASVMTAPASVQIPAQQVDAREGHVARADHHGHQEIAERRRDRRDQEEEHHDDAVHGEGLVVVVRRQTRSPCGVSSSSRISPAKSRSHEKHQRDADEVENGDALVVRCEEPRADAVFDIQVVGRGLEMKGSVEAAMLITSRGRCRRCASRSRWSGRSASNVGWDKPGPCSQALLGALAGRGLSGGGPVPWPAPRPAPGPASAGVPSDLM